MSNIPFSVPAWIDLATASQEAVAAAFRAANTAVELDKAHSYEKARQAYTEACRILGEVLRKTSSEDDKSKVEALISAYTDRIAELSQPRTAHDDDKASPSPLSISEVARTCWECFLVLLDAFRPAAPVTLRLVMEYQQRFASWIGFLGVFAQTNLSLDHRLRNSADVRSMVIHQLLMIRRNLDTALELVRKKTQDGGGRMHVEEKDSIQQLSPAMKATFSGIEATLDRLHKLGASIRHASAGQLMNRMKPLAKDERLSSFERLTYSVLEGLYPAASSELLEHMCKSMTDKYQEVLYREARGKQYGQASKAHQGMRPSPWSNQQRLPQRTREAPSANRQPVVSQGQASGTPLEETPIIRVQNPSQQSSAFSEGAFKGHYQPSSNLAARPPRRPTQSIATTRAIYAPAQDLPEGAKYADCRWCFRNYPADTFTKPALWREHQKEDWRPYVCLSEECAQDAARNNKPIPSFASSVDWQSHMEKHSHDWSRHTYKQQTWVCNLDIDPATGQRKPTRFDSEARFLEHLELEHDRYSPQQRQRLARHNTVHLSRDADKCPLCCFSISTTSTTITVTRSNLASTEPMPTRALTVIAEENKEAVNDPVTPGKLLISRHMAKHIADHLQSFTFLVIRLLCLGSGITAEQEEGRDSVDPSDDASSSGPASDYQAQLETEDTDSIVSEETYPHRQTNSDISYNLFKIPDSGLRLEAASEGGLSVPPQAFILTLEDDAVERMVKAVQSGQSLSLKLGSVPALEYGPNRHIIAIPSDPYPYDLYLTRPFESTQSAERFPHIGSLFRKPESPPSLVKSKKLEPSSYSVIWITVGTFGFTTAKSMLDEVHTNPIDLDRIHLASVMTISFGKIGNHNTVIIAYPSHHVRTVPKVPNSLLAVVAKNHILLYTGVAHGIPRPRDPWDDIYLGDVVVGMTSDGAPCLRRYDISPAWDRALCIDDFDSSPVQGLEGLLFTILTDGIDLHAHRQRFNGSASLLSQNPGRDFDLLFRHDYPHQGPKFCSECSRDQIVNRSPRSSDSARVHLGPIAFIPDANPTLSSPSVRNLRDVLGPDIDMLCVDGSLLNDALYVDRQPRIFIRGIWSYWDTHSNDAWIGYAEANAACVARAILLNLPKSTEVFDVLWMAASLFEFNISTNRSEEGYRYLVYQAGEIFDVVAEKGELWLAKNQDDPENEIGWIWSKHFAKLSDT